MSTGYAGGLIPVWTRLTDSNPTTISIDDKGVVIDSIRVCHNTGTGVTVTLTIYDGTNTRYLTLAAAVGTTGLVYEGPVALSVNEVLRATSSDGSGKLDVLVNYRDPRGGRPTTPFATA